jgi:hypothetical protein
LQIFFPFLIPSGRPEWLWRMEKAPTSGDRADGTNGAVRQEGQMTI